MPDEATGNSPMAGTSGRMWEASRNGQAYGPYPEGVIRNWIESGQLAGDVLLSEGGPWITMAEFLGLETQRAEAEGRQLRLAPDDTARAMPAILAPPAEPAFDVGLAGLAQPPQRDRIVVLGRRQSGKTVYLAMLYWTLWRSTGSLAAHSLTGAGHRELMVAADALHGGTWPRATQGSLRLELELDYRGQKRRMVAMDFAGELFAKAFLMDQTHAPEVGPLLDHIDHAAAVMLLIDPAVAVGDNRQAFMEDDFGMVQAVRRLRSAPGGDDVPIVFVLTKADLHQETLDAAGGPAEFVRGCFPTLVRMMQRVPIFQVSAVQSHPGDDGVALPRPDSQPIGIRKPLIFCLDQIAAAEQARAQSRQAAAEAQAQEAAGVRQRRRERWQNWLLAAVVALIFLLGAAGVGAIVAHRW